MTKLKNILMLKISEFMRLVRLSITVTLLSIFANPAGASHTIYWQDDADNEDGYVVALKIEGAYSVVSILEDGMTSYTDDSITEDNIYCYRVGAYNQAGTSYSDEYCVEGNVDAEPEVPEDPTIPTDSPVDDGEIGDSVIITAEFITKPNDIELGSREFYAIKSDYSINDDFSVNEISSVSFDISSGSLSYKDSSNFTFNDQGSELENGYVSMGYSELNQFSFSLSGNGVEQKATLYLAAGAWTSETASLTINAGGKVETINLPSGNAWYYIAVDIDFTDSIKVVVTPTQTHTGYSAVQLGGILLNNESKASFATLSQVEMMSSAVVDVSDTAFIASTGMISNADNSEAEIIAIEYLNAATYRGGTYSFVDTDSEVASGSTSFGWSDSNAVSLILNNPEEQGKTASLYFKAGAWTDDIASLDLIVNGESFPIELSTGFAWLYFKVDVEFEGLLELSLQPIGNIGGYSQVYFAGLAISE